MHRAIFVAICLSHLLDNAFATWSGRFLQGSAPDEELTCGKLARGTACIVIFTSLPALLIAACCALCALKTRMRLKAATEMTKHEWCLASRHPLIESRACDMVDAEYSKQWTCYVCDAKSYDLSAVFYRCYMCDIDFCESCKLGVSTRADVEDSKQAAEVNTIYVEPSQQEQFELPPEDAWDEPTDPFVPQVVVNEVGNVEADRSPQKRGGALSPHSRSPRVSHAASPRRMDSRSPRPSELRVNKVTDLNKDCDRSPRRMDSRSPRASDLNRTRDERRMSLDSVSSKDAARMGSRSPRVRGLTGQSLDSQVSPRRQSLDSQVSPRRQTSNSQGSPQRMESTSPRVRGMNIPHLDTQANRQRMESSRSPRVRKLSSEDVKSQGGLQRMESRSPRVRGQNCEDSSPRRFSNRSPRPSEINATRDGRRPSIEAKEQAKAVESNSNVRLGAMRPAALGGASEEHKMRSNEIVRLPISNAPADVKKSRSEVSGSNRDSSSRHASASPRRVLGDDVRKSLFEPRSNT